MVAPALVIFALVSGVPYIDILKTCRAAQATGLSNDQAAAYNGCVADEKEAKATLIKTWSRLSPANRQSCVDESTGLSPSYVEMLTCLEMRDGGKFTGGAGATVPPPAKPAPAAAAGSPAPVPGPATPATGVSASPLALPPLPSLPSLPTSPDTGVPGLPTLPGSSGTP